MKQKNSLGKNKTNPDFTDRFVNEIVEKSKEWEFPPEWDFSFIVYKWGEYTINRDWIVKDPKWNPMKYLFYPNKLWPRIRIKRSVKKIKSDQIQEEYYEVNVIKLLKQKFASYIQGYKNMMRNPKLFMIVPKDDDWTHLSVQNLEFVSRKIYHERGSKREVVKKFLTFSPEMSDKEIQLKTWISRAHISRVRNEMGKEGSLDSEQELLLLREKTGLQITQENFPIYQLLIASQGRVSNIEIAKKVRWSDFSQLKTNEEKRIRTDKVVRARKRLTDKEIIPRFNHRFEEKKAEAIAMITDKPNSGLTNLEIAKKLGLNKGQIDNLARQLKKH